MVGNNTAPDLMSPGSSSGFSEVQIKAITICFIINMLDGFDVLAIAFAASGISAEWGIGAAEIGFMLSSGLIGMVFGSLFLAPFADRIGRRATILACLVVITIGMFGSAFSADMPQMIMSRFITGLGIGGMLASINTMVAEYSPRKWRALSVSILHTGYPIGAVIGGIISVYLVSLYDWRAIFFFGAIMSSIMIPIVWIGLPESLTFLLEKRPKGALKKINLLRVRMGQSLLNSFDDKAVPARTKVTSVFAMFSPELRARTLSLWICFFMVMFTFYFLLSWTPKIMGGLGASETGGIGSGVLMNIGGIFGALILGYIATKTSPLKTISAYMLLCVATMIGFGVVATELNILLAFVFFMGFFVFGSMIGIYTQVADIFPALIRTTGTGWAIGIGRLGAVMGPITAGLLIESGWERLELFAILGVPLIISAVVVFKLNAAPKKHADAQIERTI